MKRFIFVTLSLILLLFIGCSAFGHSAGSVVRDLKLIDKNLDNAQKILKKVKTIIDWQIETSNAEIEALKNGPDTEQEAKDNSEEVYEKADELKEYITYFEKMSADVHGIAQSDIAQVDQTVAAAQHYFVKTTVALKDLMSIFDLYFQLEDALLPVTEFDESLYSDENAETMILDMYNAVEQTTTNLKNIECPPFMHHTFSRFIKQFGSYNTAIESLYTVNYLQSHEVYDVLRFYSIDSLIARLELQNKKYIILMTEDINLQYRKVSERLETSLSSLHSELKRNIGKLLAHAGQGGL